MTRGTKTKQRPKRTLPRCTIFFEKRTPYSNKKKKILFPPLIRRYRAICNPPLDRPVAGLHFFFFFFSLFWFLLSEKKWSQRCQTLRTNIRKIILKNKKFFRMITQAVAPLTFMINFSRTRSRY